MSGVNPSSFDMPHSGYVQQGPRRGLSCLTMALMFFGSSAFLLIVVCAGAAVILSRAPQASAAASQPFKLDDVPLPVFPERGAATDVAPGVLKREISLGNASGYYSTSGHGGKVFLYLPAGKLRLKSLPCILITGAGSNLL